MAPERRQAGMAIAKEPITTVRKDQASREETPAFLKRSSSSRSKEPPKIQTREKPTKGAGKTSKGTSERKISKGTSESLGPSETAVTRKVALALAAMRMYPEEQGVQAKACSALEHLCIDLDAKQWMLTSNGIENVITAMKKHPRVAAVQGSACAVLASLCLYSSNHRTKIGELGGCELVVNAMRAFPLHEKLQENACKALHGCCRLNAEHTERIAAGGGGELLTQAMLDFPHLGRLQKHACAALCDVCNDVHVRDVLFSETDICELMLMVMGANVEDVHFQEQCIVFICNICQKRSYADRAINAEVLLLLATSMSHHAENARIQEFVAGAFCNLSQCRPEISEKICLAGGCELVVSALRNHCGNYKVGDTCCRALCNICLHPSSKETIDVAGGVEAIITAMKASPDMVVMQQMACMVLRNMSVNNKETCDKIKRNGGYHHLKRILEAYPDEADLQEQGCTVLEIGVLEGSLHEDLVRDLLGKSREEQPSMSASKIISTSPRETKHNVERMPSLVTTNLNGMKRQESIEQLPNFMPMSLQKVQMQRKLSVDKQRKHDVERMPSLDTMSSLSPSLKPALSPSSLSPRNPFEGLQRMTSVPSQRSFVTESSNTSFSGWDNTRPPRRSSLGVSSSIGSPRHWLPQGMTKMSSVPDLNLQRMMSPTRMLSVPTQTQSWRPSMGTPVPALSPSRQQSGSSGRLGTCPSALSLSANTLSPSNSYILVSPQKSPGCAQVR